MKVHHRSQVKGDGSLGKVLTEWAVNLNAWKCFLDSMRARKEDTANWTNGN